MTAIAYFNKFSSYCRMVAHAKSLANRSVLIDHCGLERIDLTSECNNIDHVYSIEKETKRGFSKLSLIEFKSNEDAENLVKQAQHNEGLLPVPLKILRYNGRASDRPAGEKLPFTTEHVRLSCDRELSPSFSSYTELVSNNSMSLAALKLRFITLVNFERILCSGMFDEYELMPFGSSVIDMGCESGDLDLIITRKIDHYKQIRNAIDNLHRYPRQEQSASKLVHLDKSIYSETKDNSGFRGTMRWFDHLLREYMPLTDGFGVLTLHRAKVPIIKFTSRITNVECDLSFDLGLDHRDNDLMSMINPGILMTEVLYSLCRRNNLIAAFVIYMRIFAKLNSITSKMPGVGMTNFQFLSLLIFFLQRVNVSIQSHSSASNSSSSSNQHHYDNDQGDGVSRQGQYAVALVKSRDQQALVPPFKELINSGFLDDDTSKRVYFENDELNQILPLMIVRFFRFYSNFDFASNSLNLFESKQERKLDNSSIYVTNPIETSRNICHNVNRKALDTFVKQVRYASAHIRADRSGNCPLSLIKNLMIKHQRQAKKTRTLGNNLEELDDTQPFNPDGIAQDVCR
uniref:Poly(A) RNA polymerase, mitochondrial n=1 Tax=Aceria tosichella TaxID=561515 RepID=A0A6G1S7X3_9ACAR